MIETFEGRLGGGKSYTAMQRIARVLCSGGYVATNMKLMIEPWTHKKYGPQRGLREILRLRGWELKPDQIITLPDYEYVDFQSRQDKKVYRLSKLQAFWTLIPRVEQGTILVVIDEAHFHFPQSGYRSIPNDVLEFLTLSRHAQVDIIFISQHIKNMWCQMSRLAQYRWEFRDLKQYGMYIKGNFPIPSFTLPWPFPHILQTQYDYDGKTLLAKSYDWHDSTIHECYTSPDLLNAFASAGSVKTYQGNKTGLSMKEKFLIALGGVMASSAVWLLVYIKNPKVETVVQTKIVTNSLARASGRVVSNSLPAAVESLSEKEYLTGYVADGGRSVLFTTFRSYRRFDLLDDGLIVSEILPDGLRIIEPSGAYTVKRFPKAPKPVEGDSRLASSVGKRSPAMLPFKADVE